MHVFLGPVSLLSAEMRYIKLTFELWEYNTAVWLEGIHHSRQGRLAHALWSDATVQKCSSWTTQTQTRIRSGTGHWNHETHWQDKWQLVGFASLRGQCNQHHMWKRVCSCASHSVKLYLVTQVFNNVLINILQPLLWSIHHLAVYKQLINMWEWFTSCLNTCANNPQASLNLLIDAFTTHKNALHLLCYQTVIICLHAIYGCWLYNDIKNHLNSADRQIPTCCKLSIDHALLINVEGVKTKHAKCNQ